MRKKVGETMIDVCGLKVVPGSVLDVALGCIVGVSLGDRLGLPAETMTHEQILRRTRGKGLRNYADPNLWRTDAAQFGPFGPTGSASDDLACTLALLKGIIDRDGKYNASYSATMLLKAAEETGMAGWGGSMRLGVRYITEGRKEYGSSYIPPGCLPRVVEAPGAGNGAMMRISPLGLSFLLRQRLGSIRLNREDLIYQVFEESRLTHSHPLAMIGAALIALAVAQADKKEVGFGALKRFLGRSFAEIRKVIDQRLYADVFRSRRKKANPFAAWGDGWYTALDDMRLVFERVLRIPEEVIKREGAQAIARVTGTESHSLQAAPFALALSFRDDVDAEQILIDTVNAGGDTDTIGAIVMSIVGARVGVTGLPLRLIHPTRNRLVDLAHTEIGGIVKTFALLFGDEAAINRVA